MDPQSIITLTELGTILGIDKSTARKFVLEKTDIDFQRVRIPQSRRPVLALTPSEVSQIVALREAGGYGKKNVRNDIPLGAMVKLTCHHCGRTFKRSQRRHERRGGELIFCGRKCYGMFRKENERIGSRGGAIEIRCEFCGKLFKRQRWQTRHGGRLFCGRRCKIEFMRKYPEKTGRYIHGRATGKPQFYYGGNWPRQSRRARIRDNYTCQACGLQQCTPSLDVHHIRPLATFNGDYRAASRLGNLITLCRQCHSQVESGNLSLQTDFLDMLVKSGEE